MTDGFAVTVREFILAPTLGSTATAGGVTATGPGRLTGIVFALIGVPAATAGGTAT